MVVKYKLNRDIVARAAAQLSFELNTIKDSIFIITKNKCFNGKSLIGILSNNLRFGDIITIRTSGENINDIKEIFNTVGEEVR